MKKAFFYSLFILSLVIYPFSARASVLLYDDFSGSVASSANWHIPTWAYSGDGTYIGRTQMMCTQNAGLPSASNSNVNITLQTYNPTGFSFYGTDLISNKSIVLNQGVDITVRAKMNTTTPGIVGGLFLYALKPGSNTIHDEIDFEILTNLPNEVQTNIYANEPLGAGHTQFVSFPSGSINDYHTYEIKWFPTQVSWYIDGVLVRTTTSNIPTGPMNFNLNMWAPDSGWADAYSAAIQPTSSASSNQSYSMSVDSVNIQSITPSITVVSPNGGEQFKAGQTYNITWASAGAQAAVIVYHAYDASGKEIYTYYINSNLPVNANSYLWTIPASFAPGVDLTRAKIQVAATNAFDYSDNYFNITGSVFPPSITVNSPNGGEQLQAGQTYNITWAETNTQPAVIVYYAYDSSGNKIYTYYITSSLSANATSYSWTIPTNFAPGVDLTRGKIEIGATNAFDYSDNYFTIQ